MNLKEDKQDRQHDLSMPGTQKQTLSIDNIIAIMASQDIHLNVENCSKTITHFFDTIDDVLKKGHRVNTRLLHLYAGIVQPPVLLTHTDINASSENEYITPGGIVNVKGNHLVFNVNDPVQGIFYIAENKTEYRVNTVGRITESELLFFTPEKLLHGRYGIEVRTFPEGSRLLTCGSLEQSLKVH